VTTYFKAARPNGRDFHSDTVQWAPENTKARKGRVVNHPNATEVGVDASEYLSASTVPTDCTGMVWPCRLLEVEPVGEVTTPQADELPNKRAGVAFRVVRELDPALALGPQAPHLVELIERAARLTTADADRLHAARDAARDAAWNAAWNAAWYAARDAAWYAAREAAWDAARDAARYAAWNAAWDAARDAARYAAWNAARYAARYAARDAARYAARDAAGALAVRDIIGQNGFTQEHYDILAGPWRTAIGPVHPDDVEVRS
jgi:hypothetical protein